jgi:excisionase family DNA binding protein
MHTGPEAPPGASADGPRQAAATGTVSKLQNTLVRSEEFQRPRRLLTLRETAELLAISVGSARRLIAAGELPVVRFNRRLLVDAKDLDAFIQRAKQPGL